MTSVTVPRRDGIGLDWIGSDRPGPEVLLSFKQFLFVINLIFKIINVYILCYRISYL